MKCLKKNCQHVWHSTKTKLKFSIQTQSGHVKEIFGFRVYKNEFPKKIIIL